MINHNNYSMLSIDAQHVLQTIYLLDEDYDGIGMLDAFVYVHHDGKTFHYDVKTRLDEASRVEIAFMELEREGFVQYVTGCGKPGTAYAVVAEPNAQARTLTLA